MASSQAFNQSVDKDADTRRSTATSTPRPTPPSALPTTSSYGAQHVGSSWSQRESTIHTLANDITQFKPKGLVGFSQSPPPPVRHQHRSPITSMINSDYSMSPDHPLATGLDAIDADIRRPPSARPSSYPVEGLASSDNLNHDMSSPAPPRPFSYAGTLFGSYNTQYDAAVSTDMVVPHYRQLTHPDHRSFFPLLQAPEVNFSHSPFQLGYTDLEMEKSQSQEHTHNRVGGQANRHGDPILPPAPKHRTTGQRKEFVANFNGYPKYQDDPPAHLSLYEVCQQYPASLMQERLYAFIQRRWSPDEIYECFPEDVKAHLSNRDVKGKTMYLVKRFQKIEAKLKPGVTSNDGTDEMDLAPFVNLLNAPKIRTDGRPAEVKKHQSAHSPDAGWRRCHKVGVDAAGQYVPLPLDVSLTAPDLLYNVPADLRSGGDIVQTTPHSIHNVKPPDSQPRPHLASRGQRSSATVDSVAPGQPPTSVTMPQSPAHGSFLQKPAPAPLATAKMTHEQPPNPRPAPAASNLTSSHAPPPLPNPTEPAQRHHERPSYLAQPDYDSFSDEDEPTPESVFPDGMVNLRGPYVRTNLPDGRICWLGIPSAESINAFVVHGNRRLHTDVSLPQTYVPDAPFPPHIPAGAGSGSAPKFEGIRLDTEIDPDELYGPSSGSHGPLTAYRMGDSDLHLDMAIPGKRKVDDYMETSEEEEGIQEVKRAKTEKQAAASALLTYNGQRTIYLPEESGDSTIDDPLLWDEDDSGTESDGYVQVSDTVSLRRTLSGDIADDERTTSYGDVSVDDDTLLPTHTDSLTADAPRYSPDMEVNYDISRGAWVRESSSDHTWNGLSSSTGRGHGR